MEKLNLFFGKVQEKIKLIPDSSIDMIYWDSPDGKDISQSVSNRFVPIENLMEDVMRVAKPNCRLVVKADEPLMTEFIWKFRDYYDHCWYYVHGRVGTVARANQRPMNRMTHLAVFTLNPDGNPPRYTPLIEADRTYIGIKALPSLPANVIFESELLEKCDNQEEEPALLEYLIRCYTPTNGVVLDLFMKHGSAGIAALNTERPYYGVEIHEQCFRASVERLTTYMDNPLYRRKIAKTSKKNGISLGSEE